MRVLRKLKQVQPSDSESHAIADLNAQDVEHRVQLGFGLLSRIDDLRAPVRADQAPALRHWLLHAHQGLAKQTLLRAPPGRLGMQGPSTWLRTRADIRIACTQPADLA
jgi:hypothetical protein